MERWGTLQWAPGYRISTHGRVISRRRGSDRELKPTPDGAGYLRVAIYIEKQRKHFYVHRLVLETFIGPCPEGQECLHDDDCHSNNYLTNLRWGTRQQNCKDRHRNGRYHKGEKMPLAKLTAVKVRAMRRLRKKGWSYPRLGKRFGVSWHTAYWACIGQTWKHVT